MALKARACFTENEDKFLIEKYVEKFDILASRLTNNITSRGKRETWDAIAAAMKEAIPDSDRLGLQCRTRIDNLKRDARKYTSALKHPSTGGGPPPKLQPSIALVIEKIAPIDAGFHGVAEGIDTDDLSTKENNEGTNLELSDVSDDGMAAANTLKAVVSKPSRPPIRPSSSASSLSTLFCAKGYLPGSSERQRANSSCLDDTSMQKKKPKISFENHPYSEAKDVLTLEKTKLELEIELIKEMGSVVKELRSLVVDVKDVVGIMRSNSNPVHVFVDAPQSSSALGTMMQVPSRGAAYSQSSYTSMGNMQM